MFNLDRRLTFFKTYFLRPHKSDTHFSFFFFQFFSCFTERWTAVVNDISRERRVPAISAASTEFRGRARISIKIEIRLIDFHSLAASFIQSNTSFRWNLDNSRAISVLAKKVTCCVDFNRRSCRSPHCFSSITFTLLIRSLSLKCVGCLRSHRDRNFLFRRLRNGRVLPDRSYSI